MIMQQVDKAGSGFPRYFFTVLEYIIKATAMLNIISVSLCLAEVLRQFLKSGTSPPPIFFFNTNSFQPIAFIFLQTYIVTSPYKSYYRQNRH